MDSPAARAWAEAWRDPGFRLRLCLSVPGPVVVLAVQFRLLDWVERRKGATLADPVLAWLPPRDLTWLTFALIYLGLVAGLALLATQPRRLVPALQAYVVMVVLRMAAMWVTPLEAPPGMIPLNDPLARFFGPEKVLTRDLFFSGHTSTLFLLVLVVAGRRGKALFLFCTVVVGVCVIWQHVHYTIDVLAAPLFAYASYRLVAFLGRGADRS
jgi:membrane-associated phospholipid phosphatase